MPADIGNLLLDWRARELWASLDPLLPGVSVEVMARVDSTNSALVDRARLTVGGRGGAVPGAALPMHGRRAVDTQPCLLVAEQQVRGRGRIGRSWQSRAGASLTFSLSLPLSPVDWSGLSLAVGVALAEALEPSTSAAPSVLLKWPNDLWLRDPDSPQGGRKLGGILIETVPVGGRRMCVVGVGLNVLPLQLDELSSGYACLQELDARWSAPLALASVAPPLVRALLAFESGGFAGFAERFQARDLLAGRAIVTTQADAREGVAEGVDDRGALRLLCSDGRRICIQSGDVSVRPSGGGARGAA